MTRGPGYYRMIKRLGPENYEKLRQQTLKEQVAARREYGEHPLGERDHTTYKDYPPPKRKPKRRK